MVRGEGLGRGRGPGAEPRWWAVEEVGEGAGGRPPAPANTPPPPGFRRAPPRAHPATPSHQAQGHGHPGEMFGQGATPVVDPVMLGRDSPPRRK